MATNCYDCFFIFDSNKYNRDPGGVAATAQKAIEDLGGEILASRLWEERKLAYPIEGHNKGTYWITYFNIDSSKLVEFNRTCQLNDNILRFLVTKVDPRLVDALVAHATGVNQVTEEQPGEEEAVAAGAGNEEAN
ncbi:30S ribosomal protein S6 [Aureliella helgolandensis]|uniref:Small ribosomal subunit protein bS6 n=1 Tax=Aureliella helgolandensis TaxID=2527968 RepID=A0A518GDN8_9BACT|nr:30S ribosomal protein S6 [Aureliella helgolandensis]QDV26711.1 30S ribosomal protein S6 [Aureliella helgolandensis]